MTYVYVMRKVRIRTILGFCCANLGSELCTIILGLRTQTSDPRILLRKPRIRTQSSRIAQPNLSYPRQQTHDRSRTQSSSAIRGNVGSLQRMAELLCVRDRSWLLCHGWTNCFACEIDRGFVDTDGRAALHARSIVGLLPRMAEVWLRDPRRLRADTRFACAILGLLRKSSDPRFAQQNPRMVRIHTLRITYTYNKCLDK